MVSLPNDDVCTHTISGRKRLEEGYTWPRVAGKTLALYEEVLSKADNGE
jgi:glycosyltransferase involved in cell wall biosynthesis